MGLEEKSERGKMGPGRLGKTTWEIIKEESGKNNSAWTGPTLEVELLKAMPRWPPFSKCTHAD